MVQVDCVDKRARECIKVLPKCNRSSHSRSGQEEGGKGSVREGAVSAQGRGQCQWLDLSALWARFGSLRSCSV